MPADKASINIVFVCKYYYYGCLIEELGICKNSGYHTYKNTSFNKENVLKHDKSFLSSMNILIYHILTQDMFNFALNM